MGSRDRRTAAACRGIDQPDLFFPVGEDGSLYKAPVAVAKSICAGCQVRSDSLAYALACIHAVRRALDPSADGAS